MPAEAPSLAIVLCTFKRPDLLRRALRSIKAQEAPAGGFGGVTIHVVDNSDEGDARAIVAEEARTSRWPMVWLEAHPANISVARNAGVKAGTEDFVAFVDDDQELEPGWLKALFDATAHSGADAWIGRVIGQFETPERATPTIRGLFSRELDAPSGLELFAFGPQKRGDISLATNNCVFRRATCLTDALVFDPAFGRGGGEDYDLFCRLQRRGRRFVWLPEAAAREFVPAARCDRAYMRRRAFAGGQAFAEAIARGGRSPALARWAIRAKACVQAALLALRLPIALSGDEPARADYSFRWAGVLGKLSFGEIHPLYQSGDQRRS
ncbi:glycosyltransferase family 2 protein [Rhodoblastus sp.]|uniref:glycosyltransferase family 2 protein n=1 Tax=Rhodoblastus sp. TaxID=1962975 RepID=UPI0035B06E4F